VCVCVCFCLFLYLASFVSCVCLYINFSVHVFELSIRVRMKQVTQAVRPLKGKVCHTPWGVWVQCSSHKPLKSMASAMTGPGLPSQLQGITAARDQYQIILLADKRHVCLNNLPKAVTWKCEAGGRSRDLWSRKSNQRFNYYATSPHTDHWWDIYLVFLNQASQYYCYLSSLLALPTQFAEQGLCPSVCPIMCP